MTRRSFRVVAVEDGYLACCIVERPGEKARAIPIKGAKVCQTKHEAEGWLAAWANGASQ